jgi:hypothetical protein
MLHQRGYAKMFLIFKDDALVGVLSFNTIEPRTRPGTSATGLMKAPGAGYSFSGAAGVYALLR